MQATKDGHGADRSVALRRWPLRRDGGGDGLSDPLMEPIVVDVSDVLFEDAAQVARVEDEQVVQARTADAAPEPFADRIPRAAS